MIKLEKDKKVEELKQAYEQGFLSKEDFEHKLLALTISNEKNNNADVLLVVGGILKTVVSALDGFTIVPIRKNVVALHNKIGVKTDTSADIPINILPYKKIWDIRPGQGFALTENEQQQYKEFLQKGGKLVLIGENAAFIGRNKSIIDFVKMMGGGKLPLTSGLFGIFSTQTVRHFLFPQPILKNKLTYAAPGGVNSPGKGTFITKDIFGRGSAGVMGKRHSFKCTTRYSNCSF